MSDLDQAIADWRRQMVARGIKSSEVIAELESHLRDEIERQISSGAAEQDAYLTAVRSLGRANALGLCWMLNESFASKSALFRI